MRFSTFIGQVVRKNSHWKAVRVKVYKMKMDNFLKMYFNQRVHFWAADPDDGAKVGDIVLIKHGGDEPYPSSERVTHRIQETVFKVGQTVDPITGRRCRGPLYMDEDLRKFESLGTKEIFSKAAPESPEK